MENPQSHWDREYDEGRWHFLKDIKETARYGILSTWLGQCEAASNVLDVGCGEALLYHHLANQGLKHYCGVDLSETALASASVKPENANLIQSDLQSFESGRSRYSAIIFNEVLYFCEEPAQQLERYASFLQEEGVMAVSMYAPQREKSGANKSIQKVWQETGDETRWKVLDDLELKSLSKDVVWKLRLFQPIKSRV